MTSRDAATTERERVAAILALPHAELHHAAVEHLAFRTSLTLAEAQVVVATFPAPTVPTSGRAGNSPLGLFTGDSGAAAAPTGSHLGLPAADRRNGAESAWDDVIAKQNNALKARSGAGPKARQ
jgi:hypothetical protein